MLLSLNETRGAIQQKLDAVCVSMPGVAGTVDDLLIYGELDEARNYNLTNFLYHTRKHVLKIGKNKIQYKNISVNILWD